MKELQPCDAGGEGQALALPFPRMLPPVCASQIFSGSSPWLWFLPGRLKCAEKAPARSGSLGAHCARAVCPSAEAAGAALPSSSGEAGAGAVALLPDEGIAPQRARGVLNLTRQRGCFHCKTAAKGCRIPLPLFIGHHVRAGRARARPSAAPRSPLGASWGARARAPRSALTPGDPATPEITLGDKEDGAWCRELFKPSSLRSCGDDSLEGTLGCAGGRSCLLLLPKYTVLAVL